MRIIQRSFFGFIVILIIFGLGVLYSNQWEKHKIIIYNEFHSHIWSKMITTENVVRYHHKLLIWMAAYDTLSKRDQYIVHYLAMARNICESSNPNTFVRLLIATCSQAWNTTDALREFRRKNTDEIIYITNTHPSNDSILIEHFKWSCVEFMIEYYKKDLKLALPFAHRKYFQEHVNEFDWFWYTEDDLLYDSHIYWNLIEETSFAFNTLSFTQTYNLLKLYAHKGKKPKLSSFGRYFFLPTLMRFEKPMNDKNNSTIQPTNSLELWRLTDLFLCCQPLIEALIFYNEQWWFQPSNSHSAYYLLPREHLHSIVKDRNWLSESNVNHRELISSFWLLDHGYIRVASITKFDQYLVHHASNKYYDHHLNLPKASIITRGLGFEYKKGYFLPTRSWTNTNLLNYTDSHDYDIASCFPLSFSLVLNRPHEAVPACAKLSSMNKTN
jgi:hypothetical protein